MKLMLLKKKKQYFRTDRALKNIKNRQFEREFVR